MYYVSDPSVKVPGGLGYFVTRLADEYTKSLQKINPHTSDYISRLKVQYRLRGWGWGWGPSGG